MLVFGPYSSLPREEDFAVYNLSSLTQIVPMMPGLFLPPDLRIFSMPNDQREELENSFDDYYANCILSNPVAFTSVMQMLTSLYVGRKVYVCIAEYYSDPSIGVLNEAFMKFLQRRYDINYYVINEESDYLYIPKDGCDFCSVPGIQMFDADKKAMSKMVESQMMMSGAKPIEIDEY